MIDDENQTAVDDDENVGGDEDFIDFELEQESEGKAPAKRKRAKGAARLMKLSANTDVSVIMNILKMEQKDIFTSDADLNDKRKLVIIIFKQLSLPIKTVQFIEKGIYNYAIDKCISKQSIPLWENPEFLDTYISKAKNLYTNLNTKSYVKNIKLYESVKNGKINPYELAFIDTYKLFPEKWQDIIEEKAKTEKMIKESVLETATDIFQCRRCKQRKTIYCEVQTRSSDEPMTKFITCVVCGLKWKQY
jgi:DNA-directed RNA polymerase subunit M/transcription elongation factor TFIIS